MTVLISISDIVITDITHLTTRRQIVAQNPFHVCITVITLWQLVALL